MKLHLIFPSVVQKISIDDICVGDYFIYQDRLYQKIYAYSCSLEYNVVDVKDGKLTHFVNGKSLIPVEEIKIEIIK